MACHGPGGSPMPRLPAPARPVVAGRPLVVALARVLALVAGPALVVGLTLVACSSSPPTPPVTGRASGPSADPAGGPAATASAGAGATAALTGAGSTSGGPTSTRPCPPSVGSQLRERTIVGQAGAVTLLAGTLDCRSVGVWVSSFTLDEDAASDPTPRFAGRYTGSGALTARLPEVTGRCSAAAVYYAVDADTADGTARAAVAATAVRDDLVMWPAGEAATVPTAAVLQGRPSGVLVATVTGDPSRCSPGDNVATPQATVGDCWLAAPDSPGTGFRRTACTAPHTHEVYWAESLTPQEYLAQTRGRARTASTWARQRALDVCQARRGALRLAPGVGQADVALEVLWPSDLEYPPAAGSPTWARAQVVCLARRQDGRSGTQRILRP